MKKKLVTLLMAGMMAISVTACGGGDAPKDDTQKEEVQKEEAKEEEPKEVEDDGIINFDGEGYNVTYTRHETGTDYEGNPCLLYYYTFTNNSEENASAAVAAYIQCFQNGVQCDTAITMDGNDAIKNYMLDIQPGISIEVCQAFSLSDTSEITIEASELVSLDDSKDTQIIALQ